MPTTYGNDIVYCLKSHCGVRGYCRQKWVLQVQIICKFSNERTCKRNKDVQGLSCGFEVNNKYGQGWGTFSSSLKYAVSLRSKLYLSTSLYYTNLNKWLSGNFWLVSFKISYLCLPLFYETRTTPSCHPSGCAYRQL